MPESNIKSQRMLGHELLFVLPFVLVLFAATLSPIHPAVNMHMGTADSDNMSYSYLALFGSLYVVALCMLLTRPEASWRVLTNHWSYLAFIAYIILSSLWSAFPIDVLKKSTHYIGPLMICTSASIALSCKEKSMLRMFMAYTSIMIIASIATVLIFPSHGIDESPDRRWRGLTHHPNVLGSIAMIAVWANLNYLFYTTLLKERVWSMIVIGLSGLCLYGSNSITSTVLSVVLVAVVPIMMWFGKLSIPCTILIVVTIALPALIALAIFIIPTDQVLDFDDAADEFFAITGRNKTFTGRTELWEVAWSAFKQKPLLGWSFDDLMSFLPIRKLGVTQFHNGYLHLLVRGGIVGSVLLGYVILRKYLLFVRLARVNWRLFTTLASLSTAILVHNFTEASLARSQHLLWFVFVFVLFFLNRVTLSRPSIDDSAAEEHRYAH